MNNNKKPFGYLLGIGLDNKDGHKRITNAEDFSIVGGSQETHEKMTETILKTVDDLKAMGKRLSDTEPEELCDLLNENQR